MANLQLSIPPSVLARFLSEVPPQDRDSVATTALIEALDKRKKLVHTEKAMMTENTLHTQKPKIGRPRKGDDGERRVYRSVGLPQSLWTWLDQLAEASNVSVNDAIQEALSDAKVRGFTTR